MSAGHQANSTQKQIGVEVERWLKAERTAEETIAKFQPTKVADDKRDEIIDYLRKLITRNIKCRVFAYGSVPLKTFLPDGDIDLTVCGVNDDNLIQQITSLLESEAKNSSNRFVIKDVQLIDAKVKIVKCIVQDIVVDISINQIGGLCALCFLERIDGLIGQNHLFKRSIILIKTWCYYESRTVGGHAGLLSTYALELLVLYIFHVFYRTLYGPLSVLYKFLEYFGNFDWDSYGLSLIGPVRLSSPPELIVERPPNCHDLLFNSEYLRDCFHIFSVPTSGNGFTVKHLNIIDPLKIDNNVGQSVSKANSFRIRSAFRYGARKLEKILMAQSDNMVDDLHKFFKNTMTLHTVGKTLDLPRTTAEKSSHVTTSKQPLICNDQNNVTKVSITGMRYSRERKDVLNPALKPLHLSGDFNTHFNNLNYARRGYMHSLTALQPTPPPPHRHQHHYHRYHHHVPVAQWMPRPRPFMPFPGPFFHGNRQQNRNQRPPNNMQGKISRSF